MSSHTTVARSWAQVVSTNKAATPVSLTPGTTTPQEFRWKLVKKGRLRPRASISARDKCTATHCPAAPDACQQRECLFTLGRQVDIKAQNITLSSSFEARLNGIEKLRREIFETCNTQKLFAAEMEVPRIAMLAAIAKSKKLTSSRANKSIGCSSRLMALREFLVANDKDTMNRTSSNFNKSNKYFTPVGSSKAKGVSALKPTLQMQSSYDVAALSTNDMVSRPLKIAWKDRPKTIKVVKTILKEEDE